MVSGYLRMTSVALFYLATLRLDFFWQATCAQR